MTTTNADHKRGQPLGLALTDQLGPAPWADDVEAWLEVSNAEEIADDIYRYALAEVAKAVVTERKRWTEAVMAELDGNGQAHAIVAYATRA